MRPRRLACALAAVALAALPTAARADGDPASDILPSQDVFFPYAPRVSPDLSKALVRLLARVRAAGYPMKVALVETAGDLGAYPQMLNDPQRYANLLSGELPTNPDGAIREPQHLLVVMPGGFGGNDLGPNVDRALAPVHIQADAQSDGLAQAALLAVARVAAANGHPVPVPPEARARLSASHRSTHRSGPPAWLFVGPLVLVAAGVALAGRIAARRERQGQ